MELSSFRTLGRLRLVISPVALGTILCCLGRFPGRHVSALLIGASRLERLHGDLESVDIQLTPAQSKGLTDIGVLARANSYGGFTAEAKRNIFGGTEVHSIQ